MHISVLLNEVITFLNISEEKTIVDCTLGYAGHSEAILKRLKRGHLFAFDQDQTAIDSSMIRLQKVGSNFTIIKSNFVHLKEELNKREIYKVDGILFDLGVSSPQLDEIERGFSYHNDAKLDMRMDQSSDFSAYELVNTYTEEELVRIFFCYGEDKFARVIAKNIVKHRNVKPIETTLELVDIIKEVVPEKVKREKHPAKQIFQAIRIEVNHELDILESSLKDALSLLAPGGRLAVITFHSLEDRIVKQLFRLVSEVDEKVKGLPQIPEEFLPTFRLVTK